MQELFGCLSEIGSTKFENTLPLASHWQRLQQQLLSVWFGDLVLRIRERK
jgi:hypothetical protein